MATYAPATPRLNFAFDISQDSQVVYSDLPEPDPNWQYVDANGHGHFWSDKSYPTLTWVSEPCSMGHGADCDAEGHYECATCGETIRPGTREARPVTIAGLIEVRLHWNDGQTFQEFAVSPDQLDSIIAAANAAVRAALDQLDPIAETITFG